MSRALPARFSRNPARSRGGRKLPDPSSRRTEPSLQCLPLAPESQRRRTLLDERGWAWHPFDFLRVWDVAQAIEDPASLDGKGLFELKSLNGDITDAVFSTHAGTPCVLIATDGSDKTNEGGDLSGLSLTCVDLASGDRMHETVLEEIAGRMMVLDEDYLVGFDGYPKLIERATGRVVERFEDLGVCVTGGKARDIPQIVRISFDEVSANR